MRREEDGMDEDKEMILQLDTGKVIEISDYLPGVRVLHGKIIFKRPRPPSLRDFKVSKHLRMWVG